MEPNVGPEIISQEVNNENSNQESLGVVETASSQEVNLQVEQPASSQSTVQPASPQNVSDDQGVQSAVSDTVAASPLIEESRQDEKKDKDWVHKTKEIIKEYKDDPYQEEEASETLQEEYLQDRFNLKVADKEQN